MTAHVTILETGLANLASVIAAFKRLGADISIECDPITIQSAQRLVVPGVGHFGPAMNRLKQSELVQPLLNRVESNKPTLGICLGLQIFGEQSEESPDVSGLGWVSSQVKAFPTSVISPQMGWNKVIPSSNAKFLEEGYAYFANSFRFEDIPEGWAGACSEYGGTVVAALEKGSFLGCQFHPELSGAYGERLLSRWLKQEVQSC